MSVQRPGVAVVTYDGLPAASGGAHGLRARKYERLAEAARRLQAHLPVRMSAKHWRRRRLTRDGSSYRSARIPSPLTG